jgi:hypothetical protein
MDTLNRGGNVKRRKVYSDAMNADHDEGFRCGLDEGAKQLAAERALSDALAEALRFHTGSGADYADDVAALSRYDASRGAK